MESDTPTPVPVAEAPPEKKENGDCQRIAADRHGRVQVRDHPHRRRHAGPAVPMQPPGNLDVEECEAVIGHDVFGDRTEGPRRGDQRKGAEAEL